MDEADFLALTQGCVGDLYWSWLTPVFRNVLRWICSGRRCSFLRELFEACPLLRSSESLLLLQWLLLQLLTVVAPVLVVVATVAGFIAPVADVMLRCWARCCCYSSGVAVAGLDAVSAGTEGGAVSRIFFFVVRCSICWGALYGGLPCCCRTELLLLRGVTASSCCSSRLLLLRVVAPLRRYFSSLLLLRSVVPWGRCCAGSWLLRAVALLVCCSGLLLRALASPNAGVGFSAGAARLSAFAVNWCSLGFSCVTVAVRDSSSCRGFVVVSMLLPSVGAPAPGAALLNGLLLPPAWSCCAS